MTSSLFYLNSIIHSGWNCTIRCTEPFDYLHKSFDKRSFLHEIIYYSSIIIVAYTAYIYYYYYLLLYACYETRLHTITVCLMYKRGRQYSNSLHDVLIGDLKQLIK